MTAAPGCEPLHVPVLSQTILSAVAPVWGTWIDGTFGAGGHTRALLAAGAARVIGIDRDPATHDMAQRWNRAYDRSRLHLEQTTFSRMAHLASAVDGVLLDLGVSSMQLDQPGRGFSFRHNGPLDMRMEQRGASAADMVNTIPESQLAQILRAYGEEPAARRIARTIVATRTHAPFETTGQLASLIEGIAPRRTGTKGHHPATRSFQALRIAVNDELGELARGLAAAERVLKPGGWLVVVSFHSLEDRVVKRFLAHASRTSSGCSRHTPVHVAPPPRFVCLKRQAIVPNAREIAANPRARSARLRLARRTDAPCAPCPAPHVLGLPAIALKRKV